MTILDFQRIHKGSVYGDGFLVMKLPSHKLHWKRYSETRTGRNNFCGWGRTSIVLFEVIRNLILFLVSTYCLDINKIIKSSHFPDYSYILFLLRSCYVVPFNQQTNHRTFCFYYFGKWTFFTFVYRGSHY